jgi:glucuronoarabinoxylan endo-1,4-beta-xylanase
MKLNLFALFASLLLLWGCSKEEDLFQNEEMHEKGTATISAGTTQQNIRGFGGANIVAWIGDLTSAQRTKAFSPSDGIGLSVVRVRVPNTSSEFAREKATIDACKSFGGIAIASAWSAPASMKTNGSVVKGKLSTSSYAAYASHLKAFNTAVGGLAAISPANEPNIVVSYESMELTAAEIAAFVAAQGSNCGAPIMAPETFNMSKSYMDAYLKNATAKSKTAYLSGHIYGATPYVYSAGKEVWMTEHITDTNDGNAWSGAMNTAKEIHNCMVAGYSMWTWWYIRRSYGLLDESGNVTKRGYVVSHFAKYVRPGAKKVSCTANPTSGVFVTAYKSGSKLVVVAINQNSSSTYQPFGFSGITIAGFNRYRTTSSANLTNDSFAVSGGSFGITLPASSITTLVSY